MTRTVSSRFVSLSQCRAQRDVNSPLDASKTWQVLCQHFHITTVRSTDVHVHVPEEHIWPNLSGSLLHSATGGARSTVAATLIQSRVTTFTTRLRQLQWQGQATWSTCCGASQKRKKTNIARRTHQGGRCPARRFVQLGLHQKPSLSNMFVALRRSAKQSSLGSSLDRDSFTVSATHVQCICP